MSDNYDLLVLGGGSFGTTLASVLARNGKRVALWVRRREQAEEINQAHTNSRYLGETKLPTGIFATADLGRAVAAAPAILMAIPSKSFRGVAHSLGEHLRGDQILVHATKGLESGSAKRMSEILREETCALKIGALSGPNLAAEIIAGQPAGALVASRYDEVVEVFLELFEGSSMRVYGGRDLVGTELAGAFKNIVALAAGAAEGLGLGDNTKALLVTRGLSEMARFGVAMGGDVFTFGGLAGIGDLMATCGSPLSRNHQVGYALAQGRQIDAILGEMTQVAEGVPTTQAVYARAQQLGLSLSIVEAVHGVIYQSWSAADALAHLMSLPVGRELAQLTYQ